jgi:intracellular multiplication protein IcmJ
MEIQLAIKPGNWAAFAMRKADKAFASYAERVFSRDNYTCQFCGFQARDFQEIVNVDQNYSNNKLANMVTTCCFCAQCFFLESVGKGGYGGGSLIHLPEIRQTELNSLCHVLFCAITNDTGYREVAQNLYRSLRFRSQIVDRQFGEGCSEPSIFCRLMIESNMFANPKVSENVMTNMRLLPSRAKFKTQIEHWAATAIEEIASEL